MPVPKSQPTRIQIQAVEPIVDCGRYAVKATVGESTRLLFFSMLASQATLVGMVIAAVKLG